MDCSFALAALISWNMRRQLSMPDRRYGEIRVTADASASCRCLSYLWSPPPGLRKARSVERAASSEMSQASRMDLPQSTTLPSFLSGIRAKPNAARPSPRSVLHGTSNNGGSAAGLGIGGRELCAWWKGVRVPKWPLYVPMSTLTCVMSCKTKELKLLKRTPAASNASLAEFSLHLAQASTAVLVTTSSTPASRAAVASTSAIDLPVRTVIAMPYLLRREESKEARAWWSQNAKAVPASCHSPCNASSSADQAKTTWTGRRFCAAWIKAG
mmetsp:Transcript_7116/g.12743  ORF Transcript_7116/g.12743 Transcript_7116/m.12743 type:complete len:270 (+) Transcript_7116:1188-1997(+)